MARGTFTSEQITQLLKPIKPQRVLAVQGHSHVSQQDITAHLIRMFGFGNFDIDVLDAALVFEDQRANDKGELINKWDVCYRAMVRQPCATLTAIWSPTMRTVPLRQHRTSPGVTVTTLPTSRQSACQSSVPPSLWVTSSGCPSTTRDR